jgi:hypothetical protein
VAGAKRFAGWKLTWKIGKTMKTMKTAGKPRKRPENRVKNVYEFVYKILD